MGLGPKIDATPGGQNANSFGTFDEANAYHETRLHSSTDWFGRDNGDRSALLVEASRLLSQLSWAGSRISLTQALPFPRMGLLEDGMSIATDSVPRRVKEAQFELAYWLGKTDRLTPESGRALQRIELDVLKIDYSVTEQKAKAVPPEVLDMLGDWVERTDGMSYSVRLVRT